MATPSTPERRRLASWYADSIDDRRWKQNGVVAPSAPERRRLVRWRPDSIDERQWKQRGVVAPPTPERRRLVKWRADSQDRMDRQDQALLAGNDEELMTAQMGKRRDLVGVIGALTMHQAASAITAFGRRIKNVVVDPVSSDAHRTASQASPDGTEAAHLDILGIGH